MSDLRTAAMKQALEALEPMQNNRDDTAIQRAITALRAALEAQGQPDTDCHAQGICQRSGYSIGVRKPLSADSLARALVAARIIDAAAIDDPDGYDDGSMLARVQALHRRLCAEQPNVPEAGCGNMEQEPVAWMVYTQDGESVCVTDNPADFTDEHRALPLYTSPLARKPLTEDEIERLIQTYSGYGQDDFVSVTRAVERAHGIGGGDE